MRSIAVLAFSLAVSARAFGDLDRISADGVTEVGGSTAYARMLPRTRADGVLDASLLPPVADWASRPISNLYYLAGNVSVQGNGSPQYPFNELTYAFAHMEPHSALLIAPATYSGTLSLQQGEAVTLAGFGYGSYISSLAVTAYGTSASTRMSLVGVRVGTLSVSGGKVNILLRGSTVSSLVGSSSEVTVTRTDMGSRVDESSLAIADVYSGYATAPKAESLVDPGLLTRLFLSGGRALVERESQTNTVAYLSDVESATNAVHAEVQDVADAGAAMSSRVDVEIAARAAGDTALSNRLESAVSDLHVRIGAIGASWNGSMSDIASALSDLRSEVQSLRRTEHSDFTSVSNYVARVEAAYKAADATISAGLGSMQATVSSMQSALAAKVDRAGAESAADSRINAARNGIRDSAVLMASNNTERVRAALVNDVSRRYGELIGTNALLRASIFDVRDTLNDLINRLNDASRAGQSFTNYYGITLPATIP